MKLDFWFVMHRSFMYSAATLSIIALLLILSYKDWTWTSSSSKANFAHSILGILTISFAIIQVEYGVF
jgi:hypothetical protein